jgi:hypothetical protein
MSENPNPTNDPNHPSAPNFYDRHAERQERREERRAARGQNAWVGGAILIVLGIVFLLQNMGAYVFNNWWAIFILIPAIGAFGAAWRAYQSAGGRLNAAARSSLLGGLVLTLLACIFLFGLNMSILGPALIILVGVGILINAFLPG